MSRDYMVGWHTAEEWERYGGEPWMAAAINANPPYTGWGVGDDYMPGPSTDRGWATGVVCESWDDFGPWTLDDLNECVNFQFDVDRDGTDCKACSGQGWTPAAKAIHDRLRRAALDKRDFSSQYGAAVAECEAQGVPHTCAECGGHGYVLHGPTRLNLQLWMLVPRKGCSRGVAIRSVRQDELPTVYAWLREAAYRNAMRFQHVPTPKPAGER